MIVATTTDGAVDISFPRWLLFRLRRYAFVGRWPERKGGPDAEHYVFKCRCGGIHVDVQRGFGRELRCPR